MFDLFDKIKAAAHPEPTPVGGTPEYIVVGLGNPESKYERTRHNAGFMALDRLCQFYKVRTDKLKFKSLCTVTQVEGKQVLFLRPSTYMNNSGEAVRDAMQFYKIPIENVLVMYDDISLAVGKIRIRRKGSDGGHNGIKSIIYLTGKDTFPRVKIGVGKKPHPDYDLAAWVLSKFTDQEVKTLDETFDHVLEAVQMILSGKIDQAMNKFNG